MLVGATFPLHNTSYYIQDTDTPAEDRRCAKAVCCHVEWGAMSASIIHVF